ILEATDEDLQSESELHWERNERKGSVATDIVTTEEVEQEVREKLAAERNYKTGKVRRLGPSAQQAELVTKPTHDGEEELNSTDLLCEGVNASAAGEAAEELRPTKGSSAPKVASKEAKPDDEEKGKEKAEGTAAKANEEEHMTSEITGAEATGKKEEKDGAVKKRTEETVTEPSVPADGAALLAVHPTSGYSAGPSSVTIRFEASDPIQVETKGEKRKREDEELQPEPEQTGDNDGEQEPRRSQRSKRAIRR
ncbi:hypothetical protein BDN72DRAFT_903629, partial [Pluteus cervinus]